MRADSTVVPSTGGATDVIATVLDTGGNPLRGAPVSFSTTAGQLVAEHRAHQRRRRCPHHSSPPTSMPTSPPASAAGRPRPPAKITISAREPAAHQHHAGRPLGGQANSAEVGQPAIFALEPENAGTDGNAIRSVRIDFGDGTGTTLGALPGATTVAHVYNRTGTFTVTATATDALGFMGVDLGVITVIERATIPGERYRHRAVVGRARHLQRQRHAALPVARSVLYEWDFGDGVVVTTTGSTTSHRYTAAGTYHVTLRVVATNGRKASPNSTSASPV